jgi:hypothetical protein
MSAPGDLGKAEKVLSAISRTHLDYEWWQAVIALLVMPAMQTGAPCGAPVRGER